ncbi:MAG: hypothetical protein WCF74_21145 [Candidatus Sulfotelmatobacter sp.]
MLTFLRFNLDAPLPPPLKLAHPKIQFIQVCCPEKKGKIRVSNKTRELVCNRPSSDSKHANNVRTHTSHERGRLYISLGLPDFAIDLVLSPSPLVGTLHFHPQSQRRHGIAVHIEPILEPDSALVRLYTATHLFAHIDQLQDD